MRMTKRWTAFLLTVLTLASFAACAQEDTDPKKNPVLTDRETSSSTSTAAPVTETTETGRADTKDNLPDDLSLNGRTLGVYMRDSVRQLDWDGGGAESGDVIFDAVYARTRAVEERLDVKFEITAVAGKWQNFGKGMEQNIMAGDDVWQMVLTTGNAAIQSSRDFLFQDVAHNQYIDFEQPWWWTDAMKELSLNGSQIKYLVGDLSLMNYTKAGAMYFNKAIFEDSCGDADELYKLVIDRKWTYDKLREYAETLASDLNGDGKWEDGELYGLRVDNVEVLKHMEYSTDIRHFVRNEEGYPVMDYDLERAATAMTKFNSLMHETPGVLYIPESKGAAPFASRQTAFYANRLENAVEEILRGMEDDYGIIPYPLLDENQKEYNNMIHNSSDYFTIPVTCKNPEEVGAVLEALCAESYRTVIELFYDSALKTKYSRDSYSGQCIDIIRDVTRKNFLYEYNGVVKGGNMVSDQVKNNTNNLAAAYAAQAEATNQKINDLIKKYIDLDKQLAG